MESRLRAFVPSRSCFPTEHVFHAIAEENATYAEAPSLRYGHPPIPPYTNKSTGGLSAMRHSGVVTDLIIVTAQLTFTGRLERERAPLTCAAFEALLPFEHSMIQARWSGQAAWVPLGAMDINLPAENATAFPAPGELLLYPGGVSEVELLIPYGKTIFACKDGQLEGNHFLTITSGLEQLEELGRRVLWEGAQQLRITRV